MVSALTKADGMRRALCLSFLLISLRLQKSLLLYKNMNDDGLGQIILSNQHLYTTTKGGGRRSRRTLQIIYRICASHNAQRVRSLQQHLISISEPTF